MFKKLSIIIFLTISFNAASAMTPPPVPGFNFRVESGFAVTAATNGESAYWFNPLNPQVTPKQLAPGLTGSDFTLEPALHEAPSTISWGNGSSLSVGGETNGHAGGFIPLNGTLIDTVQIHFKNRTNEGTKPAFAYGLLADGSWIQTETGEHHTPLFWDIFYLDTPETSDCLTPNCADIAVINPKGMTYSEKLSMFTVTTELMNMKITSFLQIEGLSILDDSLCALFGDNIGQGCLGTLIPENTDITLQIKAGAIPASISDTPTPPVISSVPLPSSVWLFGSVIVLLGWRSGKKTMTLQPVT